MTGIDLSGFVLGASVITGIGAITVFATRRPVQARN